MAVKRRRKSTTTKRRRPTARTLSASTRRRKPVRKPVKRRRRKLSAKKKFQLVPLLMNSAKGFGGGMIYGGIKRFLMPGNNNIIIKGAVGILGGTAMGAMSGELGAGFAGAAGADVFQGWFPVPSVDMAVPMQDGNVMWVPANTLSDCGYDDHGNTMLADGEGRIWSLQDDGIYALADDSAFMLADNDPYMLADGYAPDIAGDNEYSDITMLPSTY